MTTVPYLKPGFAASLDIPNMGSALHTSGRHWHSLWAPSSLLEAKDESRFRVQSVKDSATGTFVQLQTLAKHDRT